MEGLVRERRPLRKLFQKFEGETLELLEVQPPDLHEVRVKFDAVKRTFEKLSEVDKKFIDFIRVNPVSEEKEDEEHEGQAGFSMKMESLRLKIEKATCSLNQSNAHTDSASDLGGNGCDDSRYHLYKQVQIPMVQIPTFSGHLKDWIRYWSQFEKIDQHPTLTGSDKFVYLLQSLKPDSDALKIVSRFPPSNENYAVAVEALKKKFANPDRLLEVYVRELLGIVVSNITAKEKIPLKDLFLSVDTQIRALKTLNLEKADPSTCLYPLVEACLPSDVLRQWKRKESRNEVVNLEGVEKNRLDKLLEYIEKEVEIVDDVESTKNFSEKTTVLPKEEKRRVVPGHSKPSIPTMGGFHAGEVNRKEKCLFCGLTNHESQNCFKARKMTVFDKKEALKKQFRCFICFGRHYSWKCKNVQIKCTSCQGRHHLIMCEVNRTRKEKGPPSKRPRFENQSDKQTETSISNANQVCSSDVALQTIKLEIGNGRDKKVVRAFLDNGSQRSYILKETASQLKLNAISVERVVHSLFGGRTTNPVVHEVFEVGVTDLTGNFEMRLHLRDQRRLCANIPNASDAFPVAVSEMRRNGLELCDDGKKDMPIEIIFGADLYNKITTGRRVKLECGLTAIETKFGWSLLGEIEKCTSTTSVYMDMMVSDCTIAQLWELDAIGIENPEDRLKLEEQQEMVKQQLVENMTQLTDGRFSVRLPWKNGHPSLGDNKQMALKRLKHTVQKLKQTKMLEEYAQLFVDWEKEGFIERVKDFYSPAHYIPHRPVIKRESSTTPVRPVFDASCKTSRSVSLNDCLEKGPNLLQEIPAVLMRFRLGKVGFVADIRKAFQMIEVAEQDRDSLRFLWCHNGDTEKLIEYRHARVMFGATSSPFILMAVLEHYLQNLPEPNQTFGEELWRSLYVDNCVASVDCRAEYLDFRQKAVELLQKIKMELRMWQSNVDEDLETDPITPVLGLLWNRKSDTLSLKLDKFEVPEVITKRSILSSLAKVYDPVGFSCPALMPLKLVMQRTWIRKLKWDELLPEEEVKIFSRWLEELDYLKKIEVPRCATNGEREKQEWTLHVFVDASSIAYAAVVFLRVSTADGIVVHLFNAKARVSPIKKMTIPRLELLACVLGSRLAMAVRNAIFMQNIETNFWSDSTTALAWISRPEPWATWVGNRVNEIRRNTKLEQWRHVPGHQNPADLPSRGCTPKQLFDSKWWLGPDWLKLDENCWPRSVNSINEEIVFLERRRTEIPRVWMSLAVTDLCDSFRYQHKFDTQIRIFGWIWRFYYNSRVEQSEKRSGNLTKDEIEDAELRVWRMIQKHYFPVDEREKLKGLEVFEDSNGLLRVKTRLTFRDDTNYFKYPIIVPGKSSLVKQMIHDLHWKNCHAGVTFLMSKIREKYWVIQARKAIRNVTSKCVRCRRFSAQPFITATAPLPLDRVKDSEVFQTVGVDLAGPLYVKNGKKVWMVIYTCAVYRAVHFNLVGSLSAAAFIISLKKFIEKFRRPEIIYCDNGTNFRGAANYLKRLDWKKIQRDEGLSPIIFKHSPPFSAWWGGWWERLIGSAKSLMKRTIGNANLYRSELEVLLGDIAEIMNRRPLTYVSEDPKNLEPLTPAHFLYPLGISSFPEGKHSEAERLRLRLEYMNKLKEELRGRFRKEYLSLMVSKQPRKESRALKVGELVIVGNDNKKRLQWPLGKVLELIPGKDGVSRIAKIKTADGEFIRTVQRLFPLEMDPDADMKVNSEEKLQTSSGRVVKRPERYGVNNLN